MSSTYSSYKLELIGTGDQSGTWGITTNTNLGTTIEQAIGGYVSVNFTGLTKTLTLIDTNAAQDARALYLNLTGSPGGTATLELPAIQKAYIIKNATTGGFAVTAKVTGMTGVIIPNGSTMTVYNNGTDVVTANNNFNDGLTLGTTVLSANSASDALRITQLGSGNALVVEDEANPDSSRFQIDSTGRVSIGTTTPGVSNLRISRNLTGGVNATSLSNDFTALSDVTSTVHGVYSFISTQDAVYTLANLTHFTAAGGTKGASNTLSLQYGFNAQSTLSQAAANYGFYGNLAASGSSNWNFYANGTAPNYLAGALGIGTTSLTGNNLVIARSLTGATTSVSLRNGFTILSDVTEAYVYQSQVSTQAAAFTLGNLYHYSITGATIGAGSTVTNQSGFLVGSTLTTGTNNYAFYGGVPSSPNNNWNFYAQNTAPNYMAGALGIGSTAVTGINFLIGRNLTGAVNASSTTTSVTVLSDVTSSVSGNYSYISTQAASFTLPALSHFAAAGGAVGAGSTVTSQIGFNAGSGLTQATNNYGFVSRLSAAANRWNFYGEGTAPNYMAGALGIGTTALTGFNVRVQRNLTGATSASSIQNDFTVLSDVTSAANGYFSYVSTQAAAFTLPTLHHYRADGGTLGAGSTVNYQYGFNANSGLTQATNNIGFYGNVPASGSSNWNLYTGNTAPNYMAGALGIGQTSLAGYNFRVSRNLTGATSASSIQNDFVVQSDVTLAAYGFYSFITTQAAAFTLPLLSHYAVAGSLSFGAGSTVTTQVGFSVNANLTGATNNYAFSGSIAAAANRWNLYLSGTADNYMAGALGIGQTFLTGTNLRITRDLTGNTSPASIINDFTVLSDATANATGYYSFINTQAAAFTLGNLFHFNANGGSIGAGSTVTNQYGFNAAFGLTQATNNYGFFSNIASAANRWNLYLGGTANNYMAGALGIGATTLSGYNLAITRQLTGATTQYSVGNQPQFMSDVTSQAVVYRSLPTTQAAAFTLPLLIHYIAENLTVGAGSTVSSQAGFYAGASLTSATNNYGFFSDIANAANRWNFYANGTAPNYMAGALGIGATSLTGNNLYIARQVTGSTTAYSVQNASSIASDVTSSATGFRSAMSTQAAAFTVSNLNNYTAEGASLGAGSAISNQTGFRATSSLTTAANNYGFFSDIANAANRWNFYANGTAPNFMQGSLGIGTTSSTSSLAVNKNLTGAATNSQVQASYTVQSDVTNFASSFDSFVQTQFTAFTLGNLAHYRASGLILGGGGSAVTNQYCFFADNVFDATNNYGFYADIDAGTGKWNFYANATANNAFRGNSRFGGLTAPVATVDVTGNIAATTSILSTGGTSGVGYAAGAGGAVTQLTSRTTGVTLNKVSGAITLVSAAGSTAYQTFTVTNSAVAATDVVIVNQKSGTDKYITMVTTVAAGSFQITFATTGGTTTEQPVFNFAVIKAVAT